MIMKSHKWDVHPPGGLLDEIFTDFPAALLRLPAPPPTLVSRSPISDRAGRSSGNSGTGQAQ